MNKLEQIRDLKKYIKSYLEGWMGWEDGGVLPNDIDEIDNIINICIYIKWNMK